MTLQPVARLREMAIVVTRKFAPITVLRRAARSAGRPFATPVGRVRFGSLDETSPLNSSFGYGRGQPIDRSYIERFLADHVADIAGRVLEVKSDAYTARFGGDRVAQRDVLDIDAANAAATIVDDLAVGHLIPSDSYDCIILTQTLHLIFDMQAAVATLHRALRPGGVLLLTVPGITQVPRSLGDTWFWSLTAASATGLLDDVFNEGTLQVGQHGHVLAATAFLQGIATEELPTGTLDVDDPEYPVIVTVRATKASGD